MKASVIAFVGLGALAAATSAEAQGLNFTGQYRCVQNCAGPGPAYVTQHGWDLNIVNEIGQPTRAWIDWPGHIWTQSWNLGAVLSPDGAVIQFDNGAVWERIEPEAVLRRRG